MHAPAKPAKPLPTLGRRPPQHVDLAPPPTPLASTYGLSMNSARSSQPPLAPLPGAPALADYFPASGEPGGLAPPAVLEYPGAGGDWGLPSLNPDYRAEDDAPLTYGEDDAPPTYGEDDAPPTYAEDDAPPTYAEVMAQQEAAKAQQEAAKAQQEAAKAQQDATKAQHAPLADQGSCVFEDVTPPPPGRTPLPPSPPSPPPAPASGSAPPQHHLQHSIYHSSPVPELPSQQQQSYPSAAVYHSMPCQSTQQQHNYQQNTACPGGYNPSSATCPSSFAPQRPPPQTQSSGQPQKHSNPAHQHSYPSHQHSGPSQNQQPQPNTSAHHQQYVERAEHLAAMAGKATTAAVKHGAKTARRMGVKCPASAAATDSPRPSLDDGSGNGSGGGQNFDKAEQYAAIAGKATQDAVSFGAQTALRFGQSVRGKIKAKK
jgi:hypothetical protein